MIVVTYQVFIEEICFNFVALIKLTHIYTTVYDYTVCIMVEY